MQTIQLGPYSTIVFDEPFSVLVFVALVVQVWLLTLAVGLFQVSMRMPRVTTSNLER